MPLPQNSYAATDLGLGTDLRQQVSDETDEQRKKRMMQMQAQQSPAAMSLLGGYSGSGA